MKKTKYTEEKIVAAVKQMEGGRATKEVARELGVSDQTLYNWKAKYRREKAAGTGRRESAAERNGRRPEPGQSGADDSHKKKRLELVSARRDVALIMTEHRLSERQACRLLEVTRGSYRYEAVQDRNQDLRTVLIALAHEKKSHGYPAIVGSADTARLEGESQTHSPVVPGRETDGKTPEADSREKRRCAR